MYISINDDNTVLYLTVNGKIYHYPIIKKDYKGDNKRVICNYRKSKKTTEFQIGILSQNNEKFSIWTHSDIVEKVFDEIVEYFKTNNCKIINGLEKDIVEISVNNNKYSITVAYEGTILEISIGEKEV